MAQGTGELEGDGGATPEAIRAEMRRTRAGLTRKLDLLKSRLIHPQLVPPTGAKKAMPEKRATKSPASTPAKRDSASKASPDKKAAAKQPASSHAAGSTKKAATKQPASSHAAAGSATRKKTTRKKVVGAIADKTTEVLGEMLTGAAVGAVTGAAERVADQPTAVQGDAPEREMTAESKEGTGTKSKAKAKAKASTRKRSTETKSGEVLGEMLSGAVVGAVTGAAKAVIPTEEKKGKGRAKSK